MTVVIGPGEGFPSGLFDSDLVLAKNDCAVPPDTVATMLPTVLGFATTLLVAQIWYLFG